MQQHLAAANRRFGVCRSFLQELSADVLLCHRLVLHKLLQLSQVLACVESNADAFASVASSTSGLLIVAFQTLRDIIVDNKSYIRLVDTHTEGDGSHNHVETLHQEVVLGLRTGGRIQTGMIRCSLDVVSLQHLGQLLHLLSRQTIDDTTLTWMLTDKHDNLAIYVVSLLTYFIEEVWAVERALELSGINNAQVLLDICAHLVGSRSRKCNHRCLAYLVDNRAYASILWAEVMSPLRDTVRLIDSVERNLDTSQEFHVVLLGQGFRCHIKEFGLTTQDITLHLLDGRFVEG